MTRAREGEDKKAVFCRAKHQRLPAAEQGGKKKREVENKSTAANK